MPTDKTLQRVLTLEQINIRGDRTIKKLYPHEIIPDFLPLVSSWEGGWRRNLNHWIFAVDSLSWDSLFWIFFFLFLEYFVLLLIKKILFLKIEISLFTVLC